MFRRNEKVIGRDDDATPHPAARAALRVRGGSVCAAPALAAALLLTPAALAPLVALSVLAPGAALAHSYIEVTDPADGASLSRPPERVRVTYTEPVEAGVTRLLLLDADGKPVPGTRQEGEGRLVLVLHLPPALAPGTYTLRSETLGADGHPTVDEVRFTVSGPAENPPGTTASGSAANPPSSGTASGTGTTPVGTATGTAGTPASDQTAETRSEMGTDFAVLVVSLLAVGGATAAIVLGGRRRRSGGARGGGATAGTADPDEGASASRGGAHEVGGE